MYEYILNVALRNDWSKVTYSQVHGSPVLKALLLQSFQGISATRFAELIQFWQDPKCRRFFCRKGQYLIGETFHISFSHTHVHTHIYILYIYICRYIQIVLEKIYTAHVENSFNYMETLCRNIQRYNVENILELFRYFKTKQVFFFEHRTCSHIVKRTVKHWQIGIFGIISSFDFTYKI